MQPGEPLQYPHDFPPTRGWKRFFMGVRWLGPDLSFFKELRSAQAARSLALMEIWGGGERQALASHVGAAFSAQCRWSTPYFLPNDSVSTVAGGPSFGWLDNTDVRAAIGAIEETADVKMGDSFWEASGESTMEQLVDQLLAAAGPNNSFKPTPLRGAA